MTQVAYLGVYELNDGAFAGGLLVCDHRGLPVDFRYVEPIKPTKLQRLIYGAALKRYLMVEAIGAGLFKECGAMYEITFVDENLLLELANHCKTPIVVLEGTDHKPLKARGDWEKNKNNGVIYQATGTGAPLNMQFSDADETIVKSLIEDITELGKTLDIAEPLERVKKAVAEVGGNDEATGG